MITSSLTAALAAGRSGYADSEYLLEAGKEIRERTKVHAEKQRRKLERKKAKARPELPVAAHPRGRMTVHPV
jgi:hypothetical protein